MTEPSTFQAPARRTQSAANPLRRLWRDLPQTHSPMLSREDCEAGKGKYKRENEPLTSQLLADHLAGDVTIAAPLRAPDDTARALVVEIDQGGAEAVARAQNAATALGLESIAFIGKGADDHDGGHLWCAYATDYDAERLRLQARAIIALAGLPANTECWPTGADIRLPFGKHTHTGSRGTLRRADGTTIGLDTPEGLAAGLAAWAALPPNTTPPPERPAPEVRPLANPRPVLPTGNIDIASLQARAQAIVERKRLGCLDKDEWQALSRELAEINRQLKAGRAALIATFNADKPLPNLLIDLGAPLQSQRGDVYTFGGLPGDKHGPGAKIKVSRGRNGGWIGHSYSPNSRLAGPRGFDAFTAWCIVMHGGDRIAALETLTPPVVILAPAVTTVTPEPPTPQPSAEQLRLRAVDAERKREARRTEAAAIRASVEARAAADDELSESAKRVLMALLDIAGERAWCRPAVISIAQTLGWCDERSHPTCKETELPLAEQRKRGAATRRVQRALEDLEELYITTEQQHGHTAIRHFVAPRPAVADVSTGDKSSPEILVSSIYSDTVSGEGGGQAPADDPAPLQPEGLAIDGGAAFDPEAATLGEKPYTGRLRRHMGMEQALHNLRRYHELAARPAVVELEPEVEAEQHALAEVTPAPVPKKPRKPKPPKFETPAELVGKIIAAKIAADRASTGAQRRRILESVARYEAKLERQRMEIAEQEHQAADEGQPPPSQETKGIGVGGPPSLPPAAQPPRPTQTAPQPRNEASEGEDTTPTPQNGPSAAQGTPEAANPYGAGYVAAMIERRRQALAASG